LGWDCSCTLGSGQLSKFNGEHNSGAKYIGKNKIDGKSKIPSKLCPKLRQEKTHTMTTYSVQPDVHSLYTKVKGCLLLSGILET